jgi:RHS repeat-associated protein
MRKGGTLSYLLADHLGGTTAVLDTSGNVATSRKYWPYGAERSLAGDARVTDQWYTGQRDEDNDGLGLYNYKARMYSTVTGRFLSVDPVVGAVGDPQSWNPYEYVRNNPLVHTDPSGMCWTDMDGPRGCGFDPVSQRQSGLNLSSADIGAPTCDDGPCQPCWCLPIPQHIPNPFDPNEWPGDWGTQDAGGRWNWLWNYSGKAAWTWFTASPRDEKAEGAPDAEPLPESSENHHLLPNQFREQFKKAGIDIDHPDVRMRLPRSVHKDIHGKGGGEAFENSWNKQWGRFFDANPGPTAPEIEAQLEKMTEDFGLGQ